MGRRDMEKTTSFFTKLKNSKTVQTLNRFSRTPLFIVILALGCILAYSLSLELVYYSLIVVCALFIFIFGDDFLVIIPMFLFCYIAPSPSNNPGKSADSIFYMANGGWYMFILIALVLPTVVIRLILDKEIGRKNLLFTNRKLWLDMVILGASYLLSGLGASHYADIWTSNLLFAFLQFICIIGLYLLFTATVKWEKSHIDYFAWVMLLFGLTVSLEVFYHYLFGTLYNEQGTFVREFFYTGWGNYNNVSAMIAVSIPFAFYFACKYKRAYIYLALSGVMLVGLILSCSRASTLVGAMMFAVCFIVSIFLCKHKNDFCISAIAFSVLAVIFALVFRDYISKIFNAIPDIINTETGVANDSGRLGIYEEGFWAFLDNPIFGESFYRPEGANQWWQWSENPEWQSFMPARWHNTIIQMLASCGTVGILAYAFHRFQTLKLFYQKLTLLNVFIGLSIACFLAMSLLDCHLFNLGPTLIYSLMLCVAEKHPDETALPLFRRRKRSQSPESDVSETE